MHLVHIHELSSMMGAAIECIYTDTIQKTLVTPFEKFLAVRDPKKTKNVFLKPKN